MTVADFGLLAPAAVVLIAGVTEAALAPSVHVVDDDGAASALGCDEMAETFSSVALAMASADDGDLVFVCPGTYVENIDFEGKSIHLQSTNGPQSAAIETLVRLFSLEFVRD